MVLEKGKIIGCINECTTYFLHEIILDDGKQSNCQSNLTGLWWGLLLKCFSRKLWICWKSSRGKQRVWGEARKLQHKGKGQKENNGFARREDEGDTWHILYYKKTFGKKTGIILPTSDRTKRLWLKLLEENCGWDVRKNLSGIKIRKAFDKSNEENVESPSLEGFWKRSDKHPWKWWLRLPWG